MLDALFGSRRRKLLAADFPGAWVPIARAALPDYDRLSDAERSALHGHIQLLIGEKNWEGCGGLALDDEIRVTIAAQAALLVVGLDIDHYEQLESILVYPEPFVVPERDHETGRVLPGTGEEHLGEAHYRGPVILAWAEVVDDTAAGADGRCVVYHEFAHKIDFLDGTINGTPPLETDAARRRWRDVCLPIFDDLGEAADRGEETFLDPYGATDEGEFFAVATEAFFDDSDGLLEAHPDLYEILRDFYRQDPAARAPAIERETDR